MPFFWTTFLFNNIRNIFNEKNTSIVVKLIYSLLFIPAFIGPALFIDIFIFLPITVLSKLFGESKTK